MAIDHSGPDLKSLPIAILRLPSSSRICCAAQR
jgi:hypothetical protein